MDEVDQSFSMRIRAGVSLMPFKWAIDVVFVSTHALVISSVEPGLLVALTEIYLPQKSTLYMLRNCSGIENFPSDPMLIDATVISLCVEKVFKFHFNSSVKPREICRVR